MIARLADRGEQTIARLADLPGGTKALKAMNDLRARVDELGKKVRGIDELEKRVAKLEKELAALKRAQKAKTPKPKPAQPAPGSQLGSGRLSCTGSPAGHPQPQRPRQHLEPRRRRAGLLAVELDGHGLVRLDRDDASAESLGLRVRQVRAAVDLRHRQHEIALGHVADRDDVEEAVAGQRVRAHLHPAAEVAPVRDDDVEHRPAAGLAVDREPRLDRRPAGEDGERGPQVRRLRAERLRGVVRALRDRSAHARRSPRSRTAPRASWPSQAR